MYRCNSNCAKQYDMHIDFLAVWKEGNDWAKDKICRAKFNRVNLKEIYSKAIKWVNVHKKGKIVHTKYKIEKSIIKTLKKEEEDNLE